MLTKPLKFFLGVYRGCVFFFKQALSRSSRVNIAVGPRGIISTRRLAERGKLGANCAHNGALYIPAYFLAVGQLQGDAPADARAALGAAWAETWASCTLFWVPYMSANFALVPAALRVRAMAVGNLAWCVVIDYLAHRGHGAAASAAG